jgi:hypothetical protein
VRQKEIFEKILDSELFTADELPKVPEELRKGPRIPKVSDHQQTDLWSEE